MDQEEVSKTIGKKMFGTLFKNGRFLIQPLFVQNLANTGKKRQVLQWKIVDQYFL